MEEKSDIEDGSVLKNLVQDGKSSELKEYFNEVPEADVVEFLEEHSSEENIKYLSQMDIELRGRVFSYLTLEKQLEIFRSIDKMKFANIFENMYSDIRADFYQELDQKEQIELIPYLEKKTRENVIVLSSYPPETAGGIMNTDFCTLLEHMTAEQAIAKIRYDAPSKKMIYYLFVVDSQMIMKGIVTLKDLVMLSPGEKISEILQEFFTFADVNEDREEVANKIEKYDLVAIPVLNSLNQLVGIISHEDAIDIIQAEQTEDMEKFMGIVPSEDNQEYMATTSIEHFRKRVAWIVALAAIGLISGAIIQHFQNVLEQFIILALYMPMMASTGGNSGSQAATLVIRAMALGEITEKQWLQIIWKETKVSFMLSFCIAGLTFLKIALLSFSTELPNGFSLGYLGMVIALAISLQVITSAIIGAGLPILVKKFNGDPAVAASPAITTVVDITGLLIYFTIASLALNI